MHGISVGRQCYRRPSLVASFAPPSRNDGARMCNIDVTVFSRSSPKKSAPTGSCTHWKALKRNLFHGSTFLSSRGWLQEAWFDQRRKGESGENFSAAPLKSQDGFFAKAYAKLPAVPLHCVRTTSNPRRRRSRKEAGAGAWWWLPPAALEERQKIPFLSGEQG